MDRLSEQPIRALTDRECCALLGALIGGLINNTGAETVRRAVRWWAENDEPWKLHARMQHQVAGIGQVALDSLRRQER